MQPEPQQLHTKNPHAQLLGSLGGKRYAAVHTAHQRSEHARHAAFAKHHPHQFKLRQERAEELARAVKQAIDEYLPINRRNLMEP